MNMNSNGELQNTLTRRQMIGGAASAMAVLGVAGSLAAQTRASVATDSRTITEKPKGACEMNIKCLNQILIDNINLVIKAISGKSTMEILDASLESHQPE